MKKRNKIFALILLIAVFLLFLYNDYSNKLIKDRKEYVMANGSAKFAHISIDDVINVFDDLKKNQYESIFENKFLSQLSDMHNKYGTKFSLFVFYEFNGKSLNGTPTRYKDEFIKNSDWLKFGFHAYSNESKYEYDYDNIENEYLKTIEVLKSIVGEESITNIVRLDRFVLSENNLEKLNSNQILINGLLGADTDNRPDYYLEEKENRTLFSDDYYYDDDTNVFFYNTDLRLENVPILKLNKQLELYENDENFIIFTHEWNFNFYKMNRVCDWINKHYYKYEYPKLMEE